MKTMTKLLNLGGVSVQANIAQLCYAVAKMTINFNSLIVISAQTNATAKSIINFNKNTFATVGTS